MLSLPEIQRMFAHAVFDDAATDLMSEIAGEAAQRRIAVYRRTVFANLRGALQGVYPVLLRLVGLEFFASAATAFIKAVPSRSGDLHRFGMEFPSFLTDFPPARSLPYLPDVARLEWTVHEAFHAADAQSFPFAELARLDPADYGQLRLLLHPACRLMRSQFPVHHIWQVNQPQWTGDHTVSLDEGAVNVLVSRAGFEVQVCPLGNGDYALLGTLLAGRTVMEAIGAALSIEPGVDVAAILRRAVENNAIAGFSRDAIPNESQGGHS
jgi:hypothetical protein